MYVTHEIKWNLAHYKWSDFKLDANYTQYLLETYGITVVDNKVLWGKVFTVEVIIQPQGGAGEDYGMGGVKKKKECKKIKLIFIMGDLRKEEEKEKCDTIVAPEIISDITNKLTERLNTKISLSDVQIIEG